MATDSPGWQFDKFEDGSLSKYPCSSHGNRAILFLVYVYLKTVIVIKVCMVCHSVFYRKRHSIKIDVLRMIAFFGCFERVGYFQATYKGNCRNSSLGSRMCSVHERLRKNSQKHVWV